MILPAPERPAQSPHEERINSTLHFLGLLLAMFAAHFLVTLTMRTKPPADLFSVLAFVVPMVLVYLVSALYHAWPPGTAKDNLQILDRAAIYLLIAGTYTPVCLLMLPPNIGIPLCAIEWLLAIGGIGLIAAGSARYLAASAWIYQMMGWLSALAGPVIWRALPSASLSLLAFGGLSYVVGVLFLLKDHRRYFHALSHVCVILGTTLQFWAIRLFLN